MNEDGSNSQPHMSSENITGNVPENTPPSKQRPVRQSSRESRKDTHSHSPHKCQSRSPSGRSQSQAKSASSSVHKSSGRRSRKSDAERYEELSSKWDQAKQEVRLEDFVILREKVVLQQELIRKQDEYAEQRRAQQATEQAQKREAEKERKQAKQEELQEICKQSLVADKKTQREEKKSQLKLKKNETVPVTSTPTSVPSSPAKSPTTPTTPGGGRRSNPFRMTLPAVAPTPELLESSEEEEEEPVVTKDIPWHEQQLYKLYGKNADYFLHPKIENKAQVKKSNPKLRRQGGRAGADVLWQTLRQDSEQRLLQEDASIPKELKEAYGCFARQSLRKSCVPVQRMFCEEDDLPEMPRLLDNRKLQYVRKMRHKTDLMYRASVSNQDRTEVLKFNNPLPEFHEGTESVSEYLPSWQDHYSDSTAPEYLRWLVPKGRLARENTIQEEEDEGMQKPHLTHSMDDNMLMFMSRKQQPRPKQKFVFLTEKDATVKGTFSEKFKGDRENKDIPRPYRGEKSYSAMGGMISATPDGTKSTPSLRYSAPLPTREAMVRSYTSTWQPLSMNALVEYKKQMTTVGEGEFNLGRTKMWSDIPVI